MKMKKKIDKKFNRRMAHHRQMVAEAQKKGKFHPGAYKFPGSRNYKKT